MVQPQEIEGGINEQTNAQIPLGGIQILDAESVSLCPWVEFYPEVVDVHVAAENHLVVASLVTAVHELGIKKMTADFVRIDSRSSGELIAMKFGCDDYNYWATRTVQQMLGIDVSSLFELGNHLDKIVDFKHNGELVVYREQNSIELHLDGNKPRPVGVRRCLLLLDGEKTNIFEHPDTKQIVSSHSVPGSAITIGYGAIRHAVRRKDESYSLYIQSDK